MPFTEQQFFEVFRRYNNAVWAWVALVYHGTFFREIDPAAMLFAALFLLQVALFVWYGVIREDFTISAKPRACAIGTALIAYALFLYPFIAMMSGPRYPAMPTFGLPCTTTIFTSAGAA